MIFHLENQLHIITLTLISKLISRTFPPRRTGFDPRSGHVRYTVNKVALEQVLSEYFGFPCQFSFHRLFHTHHHLSFGAGTIGQLVADIPSGLSLNPKPINHLAKIQNYIVTCMSNYRRGLDWRLDLLITCIS
jgi:hypothetical protein